MSADTPLRRAAEAFETILPTQGYDFLDTKFDPEFGELHRAYWDTDLSADDPELVRLVAAFVGRKRFTPTYYDPEVIDLRNYLAGREPAKMWTEGGAPSTSHVFPCGYFVLPGSPGASVEWSKLFTPQGP